MTDERTKSEKTLGWAILGTGSIAHQFAGGLRESQYGKLVSVGSRKLESAEKFCQEFGGTPCDSYQAAIDFPGVQAVYIGLPHHMHSEWTIKAAQAQKAILCEKPFTLTHAEAERTLQEVKREGVAFMDAFMFRYHPQTAKVCELIKSGRIGEPQIIDAEFGFNASRDWDGFRSVNSLGGGALMDVGCYCVELSLLIFQGEPTRCEYAAQIGPKGYDETGVGLLTFPEGRSTHFATAVHLTLKNEATIHGTKGHIRIQDPWKVRQGAKILVYKSGDLEPNEIIDLSDSNDFLYGCEADEMADLVQSSELKRLACNRVLTSMKTLDRLRESAGLHFEGEENR